MSKVVKKIGRTVKKVVKGIGNVAKKIVKSPIGRMIAMAALTYFGVPMVAGAMGGAAAGTGVAGTLSGAFSGAGSGLAQAWGGLTGAVSAGSLSGAADALSAGFSPSAAYGAGQSGVLSSWTPAAAGPGTQIASAGDMPSGVLGTQSPADEMVGSINQSPPAKPPSTGSGILDSIVKSPYLAPALIGGASQVIGSLGAAKMAQDQQDAIQAEKQADIKRRNANMGVLYASNSDPGPGYYKQSSFVPRFNQG